MQKFAARLGTYLITVLNDYHIALLECILDLYKVMRFAFRRQNESVTPAIDGLVVVRFAMSFRPRKS